MLNIAVLLLAVIVTPTFSFGADLVRSQPSAEEPRLVGEWPKVRYREWTRSYTPREDSIRIKSRDAILYVPSEISEKQACKEYREDHPVDVDPDFVFQDERAISYSEYLEEYGISRNDIMHEMRLRNDQPDFGQVIADRWYRPQEANNRLVLCTDFIPLNDRSAERLFDLNQARLLLENARFRVNGKAHKFRVKIAHPWKFGPSLDVAGCRYDHQYIRNAGIDVHLGVIMPPDMWTCDFWPTQPRGPFARSLNTRFHDFFWELDRGKLMLNLSKSTVTLQFGWKKSPAGRAEDRKGESFMDQLAGIEPAPGSLKSPPLVKLVSKP